MDNFITVNGVRYIKEEIHTRNLETMKRLYEQKHFNSVPVGELKFGSTFITTEGQKFMKIDGILSAPQTYATECYAVSLKTFKLKAFSIYLPVLPTEGN